MLTSQSRHTQRQERLGRLAHLIWPKIQFSQVTSRAAISSLLLAVLLMGTVTPAGACALICAGHRGVEVRRHCGQHPEVMPGMVHDHSTMSQPVAEMVSAALMSHSCQLNCAAAERSAVSRKSVLRVMPRVDNDTLARDTTAKSVVPHLARLRHPDGTPPERLSPQSPSFTVLRI